MVLFVLTTRTDYLKVGFRRPSLPFLVSELKEFQIARGLSIRTVAQAPPLRSRPRSRSSDRFLSTCPVTLFQSLPYSHRKTLACGPAFSFVVHRSRRLNFRFLCCYRHLHP